MSDEYAKPDLYPYSSEDCPECGDGHTNMEVYDYDPFHEEYEYGVDQSEVYYFCKGCETGWRYTGD